MKMSTIPYGRAPVDLGEVPLDPSEMMLYLYLPIKMAGSLQFVVPAAVSYLGDLINEVTEDAIKQLPDFQDHYVYLTAKTLFVQPGNSGNRPGWHADGYGSGGDLNYIWYDRNPTQFSVQEFSDIPDDDFLSMKAMEDQIDDDKITTYPNQHLLRLDEAVVHRVNPDIETGMRTFIKISVSRHRFNLRGNSHNYLIDYDWKMHDRAEVRNMDNKDHVNDT